MIGWLAYTLRLHGKVCDGLVRIKCAMNMQPGTCTYKVWSRHCRCGWNRGEKVLRKKGTKKTKKTTRCKCDLLVDHVLFCTLQRRAKRMHNTLINIVKQSFSLPHVSVVQQWQHSMVHFHSPNLLWCMLTISFEPAQRNYV